MSINLVRKGLGIWAATVVLVLSGLFLAGCKSHGPDPHTTASNEKPVVDPDRGGADFIRIGDTLTISFADVPIPLAAFEDKVREDGMIMLMQNKSFVVTNKTTAELEKEIRTVYVPDYFKNMTVNVVHGVQTRFYYVGGEVKSPGRQVYTGPITVTKAIQTAGDFTDFAKKTKVRLTRVDGRVQVVDCKKAILDARLDPDVYPGDKIHVPRRVW